MHIWHKRLLYVQVLLLLGFIFCILLAPGFWKANAHMALSAIFLLEIGVLEAQRRENPAAVLYHKSGFFALLDLLTVIWFLIVLCVQYFALYSDRFSASPRFLPVLFLYIILRKLYIIKNYSYEI